MCLLKVEISFISGNTKALRSFQTFAPVNLLPVRPEFRIRVNLLKTTHWQPKDV